MIKDDARAVLNSPSKRRWPDFIIIGAAKSATTWLLSGLRNHPLVYMPSMEVHYFSRHFVERDDDHTWYLDHFKDARDDQIVGEKSNSYLNNAEAARRLRSIIPDARLIAQLRNPIERAYSDYCMHLRRGQATGDIGLYLDPQRTPLRNLVDSGLYHKRLSAYFDTFPRQQIEVLLYEDVRKDPRGVMRAVCTHLGLPADAIPPSAEGRVRDKDIPVVPAKAQRLLNGSLKGALEPLRSTSAYQFARRLVARTPSYPELDATTRARLADFYREDTSRLQKVLGRDLGPWLTAGRCHDLPELDRHAT